MSDFNFAIARAVNDKGQTIAISNTAYGGEPSARRQLYKMH